jgi:hypothetical protein
VFTAELQRKPQAEPALSHAAQVDLNVKAAVFLDGSQPGVSLAIAKASGAYGSYRKTVADRGAEVTKLVAQARKIVWAFTVGFVVYRGDKLIAADLFDSTLLFEQVADKLLVSYAMTAIHGDVSNWAATPEAAPAAPVKPAPPASDPNAPKPRHIVTDDELIRRECRRTPTERPTLTGIFRK